VGRRIPSKGKKTGGKNKKKGDATIAKGGPRWGGSREINQGEPKNNWFVVKDEFCFVKKMNGLVQGSKKEDQQ